MKCGYKNCKNNGEVSKEDGIKEGSRYYCKECLEEKTFKKKIEDFWINNMPTVTMMVLRKAINDIINKGYEAKYLWFIINWVKSNNQPINYPFGLRNYCDKAELKKQYENQIIKEEYNKIKNEINKTTTEKVEFTYIKTNKFTDII